MVTRLGTAALTNQEGRTLKLAEFHGKLLVLSFSFTSCHGVPRPDAGVVERSAPALGCAATACSLPFAIG